jgi:hypothetical protein
MTKLGSRNSKLQATPAAAIALVRGFKDLHAWKLARNLRVLIFVLLKKLPAQERFALNSQLRCAVQSIGANIAALAHIRMRKIFSLAGRREVPRMS